MIHNNKKSQTGLSLIELLIAMLIGLFLLTGIASSYISSKKSSVKKDQLHMLEDNGRLALEILSRAIEHTGYTPVNAADLPTPFFTNEAEVLSSSCGAGESVIKKSLFTSSTITEDNALGDGIAFMYNSDARVFSDCGGEVLPVSCRVPPPGVTPVGGSSIQPRIYNAFFLKNNQLRCVGSRSKKVQIIADGIENIQYRYGLDTTGDDGIDKYVNASNVAGAWNNVVSVQIAILVRSDKPVKPKKEKITYTLLDQTYTPKKADRYQRAVFNSTVRLRNTL